MNWFKNRKKKRDEEIALYKTRKEELIESHIFCRTKIAEAVNDIEEKRKLILKLKAEIEGLIIKKLRLEAQVAETKSEW